MSRHIICRKFNFATFKPICVQFDALVTDVQRLDWNGVSSEKKRKQNGEKTDRMRVTWPVKNFILQCPKIVPEEKFCIGYIDFSTRPTPGSCTTRNRCKFSSKFSFTIQWSLVYLQSIHVMNYTAFGRHPTWNRTVKCDHWSDFIYISLTC